MQPRSNPLQTSRTSISFPLPRCDCRWHIACAATISA